MTRQVSPEVKAKIKQWEGVIPYVYDDFAPGKPYVLGSKPKGTVTGGVGHTDPKDVGPYVGKPIPDEVIDQWLDKDLQRFCKAVESSVKVDLNDNQFGALVSFCLNVGEGNFRSSTLLKKVNAGAFEDVPAEFMKWTKSKGRQMPGLANRRAAEVGLWSKGSFVTSSRSDTPVKPKASWSARLGALGTGTAASGTGGLGFISETKDQLSGFADITYVQYALLGLTVVGLVLTGIAAAKRFWDTSR